MKPELVKKVTKNTGYMILPKGQLLYDFITKNNIDNVLELGFAHGVSSCYIAGALEDNDGKTSLTTIDLENAINRKPNIKELLEGCNFSENVKVTYYMEPKSYLWRLMKLIEKNSEPIYDFIFIDGGHDWYNTGYAFFLVDKLLKPGGYILFDDLDWTVYRSPTANKANFPLEEQKTRQVRKVWELLVKPHPSYINHVEIKQFQWGLVQKKLF